MGGLSDRVGSPLNPSSPRPRRLLCVASKERAHPQHSFRTYVPNYLSCALIFAVFCACRRLRGVLRTCALSTLFSFIHNSPSWVCYPSLLWMDVRVIAQSRIYSSSFDRWQIQLARGCEEKAAAQKATTARQQPTATLAQLNVYAYILQPSVLNYGCFSLTIRVSAPTPLKLKGIVPPLRV